MLFLLWPIGHLCQMSGDIFINVPIKYFLLYCAIKLTASSGQCYRDDVYFYYLAINVAFFLHINPHLSSVLILPTEIKPWVALLLPH